MCGRYVLARAGVDYVVPLMTDTGRMEKELPPDDPSWNVSPGTEQPVVFPDGTMRRIRWGYLPRWAAEKGLQPIINAMVEKSGSSAWKALWHHGRVVVPCDGWFEWIAVKGRGKQPFFIRPKSGEPLYMAGLCSVRPGSEPREGDGYVVVTTAAEGRLLKIHPRRPVTFTAAAAREWVRADTTVERAAELALNACIPSDGFEFFPVSQKVNRSTSAGADLIDRIEDLDLRDDFLD